VTGVQVADHAERYRRLADDFGRRVTAVDAERWDAPTPCEGWVARDIVRHLVEWVPGFMSSFAGLTPPTLPAVDDDPASAWHALDTAVRSWFADPDVADREIDGPMGRMTLAEAINQFVTPDVLIHTWDLARATGLDDRLDPDAITGMVDGMEPFDAQLRESGHYGPRFPLDDSDGQAIDEQDRLIAFLGRDPNWAAPGTS
jgi:uncharacterized protein (TIGR03086 family)